MIIVEEGMNANVRESDLAGRRSEETNELKGAEHWDIFYEYAVKVSSQTTVRMKKVKSCDE